MLQGFLVEKKKRKNFNNIKMKSYLLISIFALTLSLHINDSDAKPGRYHINHPQILINKKNTKHNKLDLAQSKKVKSSEESLMVHPHVSEIEKKLINEALEMAFKKLKGFFVIHSRSRFG